MEYRNRWYPRRVIFVGAFIIVLFSALVAFTSRVPPSASGGAVGIIRMEGAFSSSSVVNHYIGAINRAILDDTIKSVVLRIDSPGGSVDLVEAVYLDLLELKKEKPVIASLVFAASGGYYVAVSAEYIFAEPTSLLGNVGVIGVAPSTLIPSEIVLESGMHKATGFSELLFPYNLSRALDNFVEAVKTGRGDRLKITSSELKRASLYLGTEALGVGLIDEIGSLQKAIKKASSQAGLDNYQVIDIVEEYEDSSSTENSQSQMSSRGEWRNLTVEALNRICPPPSIWYLYLSPQAYSHNISKIGDDAGNILPMGSFGFGDPTSKAGRLVVDTSHANKITGRDLEILMAELVKRHIEIVFTTTWEELVALLDVSSALLVCSPATAYSSQETDEIESFVSEGKLLILISDPAYEYVDVPALLDPMNSLSTRFGLMFANGYLYNEESHYGLYRNIYIRNFLESPLTRNVDSIALFTTTYLHTVDGGIAWSDNSTYSSASERPGEYIVLASNEWDWGEVIALCDQTFIREPFCYVEDNYILLVNLASTIAGE